MHDKRLEQFDSHFFRQSALVHFQFRTYYDNGAARIVYTFSVEAQAEARTLMLSINNILSTKDGKPVAIPSQDMILGAYYLLFADCDSETGGAVITLVEEAEFFRNRIVENQASRRRYDKTVSGHFHLDKFMNIHLLQRIGDHHFIITGKCVKLG